MSRNPWAYRVTDAQWRAQIEDQTRIIAQLDACDAAGIEPHDREGTEPCRLLWSHDAVARLGLTDSDAVAVCMYVEIEPAWIAGIPDPADWYQTGKRLSAELEARFGRHVWASVDRPKMRADAKRRVRAAQKALA